jgi:hypothetical protein
MTQTKRNKQHSCGADNADPKSGTDLILRDVDKPLLYILSQPTVDNQNDDGDDSLGSDDGNHSDDGKRVTSQITQIFCVVQSLTIPASSLQTASLTSSHRFFTVNTGPSYQLRNDRKPALNYIRKLN